MKKGSITNHSNPKPVLPSEFTVNTHTPNNLNTGEILQYLSLKITISLSLKIMIYPIGCTELCSYGNYTHKKTGTD